MSTDATFKSNAYNTNVQESEEGRKELESKKAMVEVLEEKKKSTGGKGNHTLAEDYVIEESLTTN